MLTRMTGCNGMYLCATGLQQVIQVIYVVQVVQVIEVVGKIVIHAQDFRILKSLGCEDP